MTKTEHVLIVEDEWLIAEDLAEKLSDYEVVGPAPSVKNALTLIAENEIHAAILDIRLSAEVSFPVADALSERKIPFAFLTGYSKQEIPTRFQNQTILSKPILQDQLVAAVSRLLET